MMATEDFERLIHDVRASTGTVDMEYREYRDRIGRLCDEAETQRKFALPLEHYHPEQALESPTRKAKFVEGDYYRRFEP